LTEEASRRDAAVARAHVEVDLGALVRNYRRLAELVAPARVMPVVKADGYGHGAVAVARELDPLDVAGFLVARTAEGVALREAGIRSPILVGSPAPEEALEASRRCDLSLVLSRLDALDELERFAAASGWRPAVHLKVDTGMHRLGVAFEEFDAAVERLRRSPALRWVGLMSHLGDGELGAAGRNARQIEAFRALAARLTTEERQRLVLHLANSAGALLEPTARLDVVRPGYALYGGRIPGAEVGLEPVMSVAAHIRHVVAVGPGETVGYGGSWRATRPSRIGIVGLGYADGYPWRVSNRASALVRNRRVPLAGAVSMDLVALDLTDSGGEIGETAIFLGRQGGEEIRIEDLGELSGQFGYELMCHFRLRLPHVYRRDGEAVAGHRTPASAESAT